METCGRGGREVGGGGAVDIVPAVRKSRSMPSFDLLAPFLVATFVFAYFPGPALLYTAARTMSGGRRAGLFAALGIHVGCYVHVIAATFGLSAMLRHVPTAYFALKLAGAAYLIWLGIQMIRKRDGEAAELPGVKSKSARLAFVESMLVEILNPKAALFFVAFLPQFVDASAAWPVWAQLLVMGTFVNFVFSSADVVTIFVTERVVRAVRGGGRGQRIARVTGGSVLIGLGAHLALGQSD